MLFFLVIIHYRLAPRYYADSEIIRAWGMHLTIASTEDAMAAMRLARWHRRPVLDRVVVAVPGMSQVEATALAAALKRNFNECGCGWGGFALLGTAAVVSAASWLLKVALLPSLGYVALLCVAAALVGRSAALAWSAWRVRVLLSRL